jgi:hypothetical protein
MLALCRQNPRSDEARSIVGSVEREGLGTQVIQLAQTHRVLGLILHSLSRFDLLDREWEGVGDLRGVYKQQCQWAMIVELECERILTQLHDAGVTPVLLKGAALRRLVYTAPVERPMVDLDLLVREGEFEAALSTLSRAAFELPRAEVQEAYRCHHFHLQAKHPGNFMVELHWALSRPRDAVRLDHQGIRARARTFERPGWTKALVPAPPDLILHAIAQATADSFGSLRHVIDIDRIIAHTGTELDWAELGGEANRAGLQFALAHGLSLAAELLGTRMPRQAPTRLPRFTRNQLLRMPASPIADPVERRPAALRLIQFWLLPGFRTRVREIFRTIRNPNDPMDWVWAEIAGRPVEQQARPAGFTVALKLLTIQFGVWFRKRPAVEGPPNPI